MYCKNCGNRIKTGAKFCNSCGTKVQVKNVPTKLSWWFSKYKKGIAIFSVLAVLLLIIIIGSSGGNSSSMPSVEVVPSNSAFPSPTPTFVPATNEGKNISSVVNIFCDNKGGGSGTILTKEGMVVTNNHVIANSTFCLVTIPDEESGVPIEMYVAKPLIVPTLSEQYDIAMLEIDSAYTDSSGKAWGTYPKIFPQFKKPASCTDMTPRLGDSVRIYGYPVTSGGYNLTITDGVISSFSNDDNILTSAKIDSGNSGGLAVNQNGCMIGIPSAVLEGNYQNLGVIIPSDVVLKFFNEAIKQEESVTQ